MEYNGLSVEAWECNDFGENTYLVHAGGEAIIVDAGCGSEAEWEAIRKRIESLNLRVVMALNTHGHIDHVLGVGYVLRDYQCPFALHPSDIPYLDLSSYPSSWVPEGAPAIPQPTQAIADEDPIKVGRQRGIVIATPGHTSGGCCIYFEEAKVVFTGDTLFSGSIGRVDLPGGSYEAIMESIRMRLFSLPGETTILPGHGPASSIARESKSNPFFN